MAGAFAEAVLPPDIEITCAGMNSQDTHPLAVKAMQEVCAVLPQNIATSLNSIKTIPFDIVVALCDKEEKGCPELPGSPALFHWEIPDPLDRNIDAADLMNFFRHTRDEIMHKISHFVEDGYFDAIKNQRQILGSLVENMIDGVLAHDSDRRIFFFNRSAQRITGYNYSEVVGRDCHEVFPGRFCGGFCNYCEEEIGFGRTRYNTTFVRKDGKLQDLVMSSVIISDSDNDPFASLIIFRNARDEQHSTLYHAANDSFQGIIGKHPLISVIFDTIHEVSNINVPILIEGESGTGKEMVANAIHNLSSRAKQPFVPVNCGALPEGTLESELFGHVRGAFTGAIRDKKGRFELAEGGTIFLDEIGELPPLTQVKLLRVVQEKSFTPVGGEKDLRVDVRIICATNKKIKECVQQGLFREDLYYRLAVVPITLPPLRQRVSDIPLLVEYFLEKLSINIGRNVGKVSQKAMNYLQEYRWPGNIRELINALQFSLIKCHEDTLDVTHLPREIIEECSEIKGDRRGRRPKLDVDDVTEAIKRTGGNKSETARLLRVSRPTLYSAIKRFNL